MALNRETPGAASPTQNGRGSGRAKRVRAAKAVLFDFDGTLTLPGHLDFGAIRTAIGCPQGESLLAYIVSLEDLPARRRAEEILDDFETQAADHSHEDPDAGQVVRACRERGLKLGIITRNSRKSVERSFAHFSGIAEADFDILITRDDPVGVKPEPDGVLLACERLGVEPAETILVGDFLYDIEAGERAGAVTVFYDSDPARPFVRPACDHSLERLGDLVFILSLYEPLPAGKVPNDLLRHFLAARVGSASSASRSSMPSSFTASALPGDRVPAGAEASAGGDDSAAGAPGIETAMIEENRNALIVGPSVGEDVAAITMAMVSGRPSAKSPPAKGGRPGRTHPAAESPPSTKERGGEGILLLKSDPITFVAEDFGHYLLTVNANDIATAGGTPRWLLATLLVPPGTLGVEIGRLFDDLREGCEQAGVVLCGGHTELTDAVTRPVVSGTMVGTVDNERLLRKSAMRTGDRVILTKGVAVEGTGILAASYADELRRSGVSDEVIRAAASLRERMSVQPEARIAASYPGVSAMHDVTEGGIATALRELAIAGGHRLRIDVDAIPVLPESREICDALDLDPLGLIGSGSLLICVAERERETLTEALAAAGIPVSVVGEVLEAGEGIEALLGGHAGRLPDFAADEITRVPHRHS